MDSIILDFIVGIVKLFMAMIDINNEDFVFHVLSVVEIKFMFFKLMKF